MADQVAAVIQQSAIHNFTNSFLKRPILFLVLFAVLAIIIAMSTMVHHLTNTEQIIENTDEFEEWNGMLNYLNNLTICVYGYDTDSSIIPQTRDLYNKSIAIEADIDDLYTYKPLDDIIIEGHLNLIEWTPKYPKFTEPPMFLKISLTGLKLGVPKACLVLTGPDEYLPSFAQNNNCSTMFDKSKLYPSIQIYGDSFERIEFICRKGLKRKFNFHLLTKIDYVRYLNGDDYSIIYVLFMLVSYLLGITVIIILLYGLFYKKRLQDNTEHLTYLINPQQN